MKEVLQNHSRNRPTLLLYLMHDITKTRGFLGSTFPVFCADPQCGSVNLTSLRLQLSRLRSSGPKELLPKSSFYLVYATLATYAGLLCTEKSTRNGVLYWPHFVYFCTEKEQNSLILIFSRKNVVQQKQNLFFIGSSLEKCLDPMNFVSLSEWTFLGLYHFSELKRMRRKW